jgi:tetraacyldisaccharide 4'-kinase
MTEKDAVKCRQFAGPQHWYLPIRAIVPNSFGERLLHQLEKIQNG